MRVRLHFVALSFATACFLPELTQERQSAQADPCTECAASACAGPYGSCFDSTACTQLVGCVFSCAPGDDACVVACTSSDGAALGLERALPLAECTSTSCADSCPTLPGFGAGGAGGM